jgi:hypothetical protein
MRTLIVIAASLLIAQYGIAQPPAGAGGRGQAGGGRGGAGGGRGGRGAAAPLPPPDPGFECFDHAEVPDFPQAALRSKVDGTVWMRIQLTAQGTVGKMENEVSSAWGTASKLLVPPVEKAIQASKFKSDCSGKTVAVVYRYELHGDAIANPKPTNKMESPNIMFIDSQPEKAALASAAAKPAAK